MILMMEKKNPCIVMVPSPGLSHLIPLVEFAKILIHHDDELHVKFIVPTLASSSSSMDSILNNSDLPPNITFTVLPQVNIEDLPVKSQTSTQIRFAVKHSLPFIHQQLTSFMSSTTHHIVALVFSIFATDVLDLAKEFNLLTYVFFASGASLLSFCLYLPYLDQTVFSTNNNNTKSLTETVNFPGCVVPFQIKDLPDPVLYERSSEVYKSFITVCRTHSLVDGAIVNTFTHLESEAIAAIEQQREANNRNTDNKVPPFVYPIGPIIQSETSNRVNRSECLAWLDNQPPRSVLYISFGSGGTLSQEQLNEIAFGLELSGHKFLWVVRAPNEYGGGAYLNDEEKEDPLHYLPSGFVDRTKGEGLVVPSWAPQVEILGHGSTSAFLSHCGWNSILESVVYGVPMIAWPLFAEQRMNAVLLKDVLKVALMPEKADHDGDGIVKREEIAEVIKRMMEENEEGSEMRKRMKELSDAAAAALSQNGSSTKAFSTLTQKWKNV